MLNRVCVFVQRVLLCAWVGAAVLFVITSVAEQQFDGFASSIKNQLAMIRFPKYYVFGSVALLTSLGCSTVRVASGERTRASFSVLLLLFAANVLMLIDFVFIYLPLHEIMVDLLRPRDDDFQWYHNASKYINSVGLLLTAIAAAIVCGTESKPR